MVSMPPSARPLCFEGYGPGGAAVLIECLTDDGERTRALLRGVFRAHGGYLGAEGSVSYLFHRVGRLGFAANADRARLRQAALEAGAEDVADRGDAGLDVLTDPEDLEAVRAALAGQGWVPVVVEVTERSALTLSLAGGVARQFRALLEALAEVHGVRSVYSNVEISDAVLARV